ncbi:MAG: DUF3825 domain-containing protein [Lachnospiraceae bacterium]|nr:DUF3825 domain-containing protein [Lachnospiraceae bacterium]
MLTEQNKADIYAAVTEEFRVGGRYPLTAVSKYLSTKGYNARRFGYTQMKVLMRDLPDLFDTEVVKEDGSSVIYITIREKKEARTVKAPVAPEDKETATDETYSMKSGDQAERIQLTVFQKSNFESFTSAGRNYSNFSRNYGNYRPEDTGDRRVSSGGMRFTGTSGNSIFKEPSAEDKDVVSAKIETAAVSGEREEGSSFERLAYLPAKVLDFLYRKGIDDPTGLLSDSYLKSIKEKTYQQRGNTITFPITWGEGQEMVAVLKRNEKSYGRPWYLSYVGFPARETEPVEQETDKDEASENRPVTPGKALEDFADIGYWQEFLKELASLAIPEMWDFRGNRDNGRFYILKKYIQYTFYRLQQEEKICVAKDNFAAFNTGLVNNRYQEIYACFVPNPKHDGNEILPEWRFESFAIAGQRGKYGAGKLLTGYFDPLPQLPTYYEKISDLYFDPEAPLDTDCERLILDNIERLPKEYLKECCFSDDEALGILDAVEAAPTREKKKQAYYAFSTYISENERLFRRMKDRMEDALDIAGKRARWNFRTAVPCFFSKTNSVCYLLPLALLDDGPIDAVLMVMKDENGGYQGQIILEPEKAYLNARLICRPGSDWMTVESISQNKMLARQRSYGEEQDYMPGDRRGQYGDHFGSYDRGETYRSDYGRVYRNDQPRYGNNGYRRQEPGTERTFRSAMRSREFDDRQNPEGSEI